MLKTLGAWTPPTNCQKATTGTQAFVRLLTAHGPDSELFSACISSVLLRSLWLSFCTVSQSCLQVSAGLYPPTSLDGVSVLTCVVIRPNDRLRLWPTGLCLLLSALLGSAEHHSAARHQEEDQLSHRTRQNCDDCNIPRCFFVALSILTSQLCAIINQSKYSAEYIILDKKQKRLSLSSFN